MDGKRNRRHKINHLSIAALFSSPYGYLGQLVLFYILANLSCYYYCIMLGTNKVVVVVVVHKAAFSNFSGVVWTSLRVTSKLPSATQAKCGPAASHF